MAPKPAAKKPVKRAEPESDFDFEVIPAREASSPLEAMSLLVLGPPKVGKSHLLASFCKDYPEQTLLIATLNRERTSEGYQKYNPDTIKLNDNGWRPTIGKFEATAFQQFLQLVEALQDDEQYKCILLDNGTELGEFAWHEALAPHGVASPADMDDKFRPYVAIADLMKQAMDGLFALKDAKVKKHIIISWHLQTAKDDQVVFDQVSQSKVKKQSADNKGSEVEYMGNVLPMMQGGFRRKIAGLADGVVYSTVRDVRTIEKGKPPVKEKKYMIQISPDEDRHASIPALVPKDLVYIPNEWSEIKKLLKAGAP